MVSATAALSTLVNAVVRRHDVTISGFDVACSCGAFKLNAAVWGASATRSLSHAHLARPDLPVAALVEFVVEGEP